MSKNTTKTELVVPPYTGWRPRSMRLGKNRSETTDRNAKRSRLGNSTDRFLYKSAGSKEADSSTRYSQLCKKVNALNGSRGV